MRPPKPREVRVRVLAASVSAPDVQARYGRSPFRAKIPFVPGYSVVGVVDAVGPGVARVGVGDRVAALTIHGGYAEYAYVPGKSLIPVAAGLDPAQVVPLILNYLVAYQVLHRSAGVRAGERVLIIGASGGIGTALLQLGRLAGLRMYAVASRSKHHIVRQYGAIPIDYRTEDFVQVVRAHCPAGLDAVFDGMAGGNYRRGYSLLSRGGRLVGFGNPLGFAAMLRLLALVVGLNLVPDGRVAKLYSTGTYYLNRRPFLDDWAALFDLLEQGAIHPVIAATFPITDAAAANALYESGQSSATSC